MVELLIFENKHFSPFFGPGWLKQNHLLALSMLIKSDKYITTKRFLESPNGGYLPEE